MIRAFAGRMPVLGVCLGHQALIEVYGGAIVRAERLMHGKTSPVLHDGRGLFAGLPNPFDAGRYHSLIARAREDTGRIRSHGLDRGRRGHGRAPQDARARGRAVPPGEHPDARWAEASRGVSPASDMTTTTGRSLSKVPEVTLLFWIIKIAATTLGETGGDALSMSMNLGYLVAHGIFCRDFPAGRWRPDRGEALSSVPLLDDDHRHHDRRHDARRLRGPFARHRYAGGRRCCSRCCSLRSRSGIARSGRCPWRP